MNGSDLRILHAIRESGAGRWMMFVDGENFTMSFQRLAASLKLTIPEGTHYSEDAFVWAPQYPGNVGLPEFSSVIPNGVKAIRSYFYTSLVGDENELDSLREKIWNRAFTPEVFKRPKGGRASKGVDIALARDLLVHSFEDHLDVAVLVAGDADYLPLVHEVKRRGKRVVLAFLKGSSSLSTPLRRAADIFVDIEGSMLNSWSAHLKNPPKSQ